MNCRLPAALLLAASTLSLPGCASAAQAFATDPGPAPAAAAGDDYTSGTEALDQQRWQDAVTAFDRVIAAKGKRADAALYWKAYALNKLGRSRLVSATCDQLRSTYARSTWNGDCSTLLAAASDPGIYVGGYHPSHKDNLFPRPQPDDYPLFRNDPAQPSLKPEQLRNLQKEVQALRVQAGPNAEPLRNLQKELQNLHIDAGLTGDQVRDLQAQVFNLRVDPSLNAEDLRRLQREVQNVHVETAVPNGSDADLKMLALNSLMQRDPAQALPAIRGILTGNSSPQLKKRGLTALAMSQSSEAQTLLRDVATGKIAPTEQRTAIQMLGTFQGKRAADTLAEIYRNSTDRAVKRSALSGLFISGDATRMVDLARNEKDLQLKHDIVAQLALMHDKAATDYMLELLK